MEKFYYAVFETTKILYYRSQDTISANEFLWVAVSRSWVDRDELIHFSTLTLIFLSMMSKMTLPTNVQRELRIQLIKKTEEIIRKLKSSRSSFQETKTSRVTEGTITESATPTETVSDTRMGTKMTTLESLISINR